MSNIYRTIPVEFGEFTYPIVIGRGLVDNVASLVSDTTKNKKVVIVYDSFFENTVIARIVSGFERTDFEIYMCPVDGGKSNKNFNEVLKIYGVLEENNIARDSTLIAVGGGVVGDMAGFIASTWLRGMNLIHIPTTLMAMVDSSIGGKVAINFRNTINAVGNYYHPVINVMDFELIDTLSDRDYNSGIAEVLKCAVIADANLFDYLSSHSEELRIRDKDAVLHIIQRAIEIKIAHVQGDVREGSKRLLLNYGHTLGHSIEVSTTVRGHETYRHGEGVAIGMVAVLHIAKQYVGADPLLLSRVESLLSTFDLPARVDVSELPFDRQDLLTRCISNVKKDKKRINNYLRVILASNLGHAAVYDDVPFSMIEDAFAYVIQD